MSCFSNNLIAAIFTPHLGKVLLYYQHASILKNKAYFKKQKLVAL